MPKKRSQLMIAKRIPAVGMLPDAWRDEEDLEAFMTSNFDAHPLDGTLFTFFCNN